MLREASLRVLWRSMMAMGAFKARACRTSSSIRRLSISRLSQSLSPGDGTLRKLIRSDVRLLAAREKQPLQQERSFEHRGERHLRGKAFGQEVLVRLVAQRLDDAPRDGQGAATGRLKVLDRQGLSARHKSLQGSKFALVLFLNEGREPDAGGRLRLGTVFAGLMLGLTKHTDCPRRCGIGR